MNKRILNYRRTTGMSQVEVARVLDISVREYQLIEQGISDPAVSLALLLCETITCTVEEAFGTTSTTVGYTPKRSC